VRRRGKAIVAQILKAVSFLDVRPSLVIGISASFETKIAPSARRLQFDGAFEAGILSNGKDDLFEQVTFRNRSYGALVQVAFGEPFRMEEPFLATDLLAIPGRSL
jgi:hypothetical protein